jgi:drug/metabolite transporter (DMT)-like permease
MSNIITPYVMVGIIGEAVLSIYPFLIKATKLDIPTHTFVRLASYFSISAVFANYKILASINPFKLLLLALINIGHILSSYKGFRLLYPSLAQSIFYIYPFFNLLLNIIVLNYKVNYAKFAMIIPVVLSIYSIYKDNGNLHEAFTNMSDRTKGTLFVLLAAVTESLLYIFIRTTDMGSNIFTPVLATYGLAAFLYGIYYLYNKKDELRKAYETNRKELIYVILGNIVIAILGYGFRFFAISKVEPVIFSILSYTGIFTVVLYNLLFKLEIIGIKKILSLLSLFVSLVIFQRI